MNDPNFVVETLHEAKGDFMIRTAVTDDAIPLFPYDPLKRSF